MRRCILVLGLFAAVPSASAQSLPQVETAEPGIFFEVPDGWERLPGEIISAFRAREEAAGLEVLGNTFFAAGLQGPEGDDWLDLPYLLIRLDPTIHVTSAEFRREMLGAPDFEFSREDGQRVREHGIARAYEFGVAEWDEQMDGAIVVSSMTTGEGFDLLIFQASRALPGGLLHAYYYATPGTDPAPIHTFMRSFMQGVTWPGDPARVTRTPLRTRVAEKGVIGLLVGGFIGMLTAVLGTRRKETPTES